MKVNNTLFLNTLDSILEDVFSLKDELDKHNLILKLENLKKMLNDDKDINFAKQVIYAALKREKNPVINKKLYNIYQALKNSEIDYITALNLYYNIVPKN